jgi:D-serine deaminase-like pyridoxal phosphate-dependent protein
MRVEELDTPVLTIDLDALETNLDRYQRYYTEHGIGLRPHIKTHKTLAIAHMQMARGAIGLTCQKIGEAEVMVGGGITSDIMIPYNILGAQKLDRLTALARRVERLTVAADSAYTIRGLSAAAAAAGVKLGVVVEVETGSNRTGVTPHEAVELGQLIEDSPGLETAIACLILSSAVAAPVMRCKRMRHQN